ncbi:hypothetical protein PGB90_001679 [Kerria lacca]
MEVIFQERIISLMDDQIKEIFLKYFRNYGSNKIKTNKTYLNMENDSIKKPYHKNLNKSMIFYQQ